MKLFSLALSLWLSLWLPPVAHAQEDGALTQDLLTSEFVGALSARMPAGCKAANLGALQVGVTCTDGRSLPIYLENLWVSVVIAPDERWAMIAGLVQASVTTLAETSSPALDGLRRSIRAVIRNSEAVDAYQTAGEAVVRQLVKDLWIVYVVDAPENIRVMTKFEQASLGLEDEIALSVLAVTNLKDKVQFHKEGTGPVGVLRADGVYESALILIPSAIDHMRVEIEGDLLVSIPARDLVLFTGTGDPQNIERLRQATNQTLRSARHPVSNTMLRWVDDHWEIYGW